MSDITMKNKVKGRQTSAAGTAPAVVVLAASAVAGKVTRK